MTTNGTSKDARPQAEAVPYQGEPLPNKLDDLVIPNVLSLDCDERLWVPQAQVCIPYKHTMRSKNVADKRSNR